MRLVDEGGKKGSQSQANTKTDQDMNFYRKVSKYDLDQNKVDWNALLKERER